MRILPLGKACGSCREPDCWWWAKASSDLPVERRPDSDAGIRPARKAPLPSHVHSTIPISLSSHMRGMAGVRSVENLNARTLTLSRMQSSSGGTPSGRFE